MAQALLEKTYRVGGNLIQFGSGKDGGREATWSQPIHHPTYSRPLNKETNIELRLYAKWISKQQDNENQLARYIVESLINPNTSAKLITPPLSSSITATTSTSKISTPASSAVASIGN
jgi:hypothetical protein